MKSALAALSFALCLFPPPAPAQAPEPLGGEERSRLMDRARALREEAAAIRQEAERRHALADKACWDKVFVSSCQGDAKEALREENARARRVEQEARDIERAERNRELAEKEARRIEEAPERAAKAAERAEKYRRAREEAVRRIERKQAEAAERQPGGGKP